MRLGDYRRHLQSRGEPPPSAWIDDETNTGSFSLNLFDHRGRAKTLLIHKKMCEEIASSPALTNGENHQQPTARTPLPFKPSIKFLN